MRRGCTTNTTTPPPSQEQLPRLHSLLSKRAVAGRGHVLWQSVQPILTGARYTSLLLVALVPPVIKSAPPHASWPRASDLPIATHCARHNAPLWPLAVPLPHAPVSCMRLSPACSHRSLFLAPRQVNLVGGLCLGGFVTLLYVEQSFINPREKAERQLPVWRSLSCILLVTLVLRYVYQIPWVQAKLLSEGGWWGVRCNAALQEMPTACNCILQVIAIT